MALPALLLALLLAVTGAPGWAQPDPGAPLRVGVAGSPPFVIQRTGLTPNGLAVQTWLLMAEDLDWEGRIVPMESVPKALEALERGELDLVVGAVSITAERAEKFGFTQPWFRSSLAILAHPAGPSLLERIRPFLSTAFGVAVGVLASILGLVGLLLWLLERRANPDQFPGGFIAGVGNGVWLALVTMTTVGYGDRAPVTPAGRFVAGLWMLISMLTASTLTAGLATAFTLSQIDRAAIDRPDMLKGRRVAVVPGTTAHAFAAQHGARILEARAFEGAVRMLQANEADAVVYDRPIIQYYLKEHPETDLIASQASYELQNYGFALPVGSPRLHPVNVSLLKMYESGRLKKLVELWLGPQGGP